MNFRDPSSREFKLSVELSRISEVQESFGRVGLLMIIFNIRSLWNKGKRKSVKWSGVRGCLVLLFVVVVGKSWALTFNEFLRVFGHRNRIQLEILGRSSQVLMLGKFLKVSKQKKLF